MKLLQFDRGKEHYNDHADRDPAEDNKCCSRTETKHPENSRDRLEDLSVEDRHGDVRKDTADHSADHTYDHKLKRHRRAELPDRMSDRTKGTDVFDISVDIVVDRKDDHDQTYGKNNYRKSRHQTGKNIRNSRISFLCQIACIRIEIQACACQTVSACLKDLILRNTFSAVHLDHLSVCDIVRL